ncbi:MAG: metallophosphoesterase [archaeon]
MKILVLSDIHSRKESLEKLLSEAGKKEIDLVIAAGDLTNFGGQAETEKIIEKIKKLNKKIFAIPGNLDTKESILFLEKEGISIHSKKEKYNEFTFIGFGGATDCMGEIIFTEKELYESLKELMQETGKEKVFLITHSPPKNSLLDKNVSGKHIGSDAIRKIITEFEPEFSVSGHCHESFGKEKIGKTTCINPGAVKENRAALIDTKTKKTEFMKI